MDRSVVGEYAVRDYYTIKARLIVDQYRKVCRQAEGMKDDVIADRVAEDEVRCFVRRDVVEVEIPGIGTLRNPVIAEK